MASTPSTTALVVLGMHRSGTSCLAGMLQAAGVAAAGPSVRNWDNARGHFERLELVRLNEAVLFRSGGHWLGAPGEVRWTDEEARERDRLLATPIEGRPALLKDPRTLLCLPFWRASGVSFRALGIVRHPLAAARSLRAWRGLPLAQGLELWSAHNRALLADHEAHGTALIDFEGSKPACVAAVAAACARLELVADGRALEEALEDAYDERLVHHDEHPHADETVPAEARALHEELVRRCGGRREPSRTRARFPTGPLARCEQLLSAGDVPGALAAAGEALAGASDAAAVAVPVVSALLRVRAHREAEEFVARAAGLERGLAELLRGKIALARGEARAAVEHLRAAASMPAPTFQALRLLPHALRQAGRGAEAEQRMAELAPLALYPHGPLSLLAEWAWDDGRTAAAQRWMAAATEAAPRHRRGRLRARLAEWHDALGDPGAARAELERALEEDPTYPRARAALARLGASTASEA